VPVFGARLELVNVVVAAHDRRGRPVPDLGAQDFVVREDGRLQTVTLCVRIGDVGSNPLLDADVALLLDVSGSMADKVKVSRLAASKFLDAVPRAQDRLVILFHHEVRGFRYEPAERQAALDLIANTEPGGGTAFYDALVAAIGHLGGSRRQVLVAVTDGQDHGSRHTLEETLQAVRSSPVTIFPITCSDALYRRSGEVLAGDMVLERLARTSGGRVFETEDAATISQAYDSILADLASQYVVGFTPSDTRPEGAYRKLKVEVQRPGVTVRHREGYVAPKH
jgi:VWFA-related protein